MPRLIEATVHLGFNNVIDAFHYVNRGEIDKRFSLMSAKPTTDPPDG